MDFQGRRSFFRICADFKKTIEKKAMIRLILGGHFLREEMEIRVGTENICARPKASLSSYLLDIPAL